jgi:hypothetical protein
MNNSPTVSDDAWLTTLTPPALKEKEDEGDRNEKGGGRHRQ